MGSAGGGWLPGECCVESETWGGGGGGGGAGYLHSAVWSQKGGGLVTCTVLCGVGGRGGCWLLAQCCMELGGVLVTCTVLYGVRRGGLVTCTVLYGVRWGGGGGAGYLHSAVLCAVRFGDPEGWAKPAVGEAGMNSLPWGVEHGIFSRNGATWLLSAVAGKRCTTSLLSGLELGGVSPEGTWKKDVVLTTAAAVLKALVRMRCGFAER